MLFRAQHGGVCYKTQPDRKAHYTYEEDTSSFSQCDQLLLGKKLA